MPYWLSFNWSERLENDWMSGESGVVVLMQRDRLFWAFLSSNRCNLHVLPRFVVALRPFLMTVLDRDLESQV